MNLYNLLKTIKDLSALEMVNSAFIGDVYEINSKADVEYPAFIVTEGTHVGNTEEDTEVYSLSLFLVDRLTEDKSNELDIKSWANEGVKDLISRIEETNIGLVQNGWQVTTFTERFESLCAGAYATIQIEIDNDNNCCGDQLKLVTSINGKTGDVYIPGIEGDIVTSFNGKTGDIVYEPDLSDYYTKEQVDEKVIKAGKVSSVNGQTGDVVIDIPNVPTNVSAFNNDAGYLTEHQDISNLATKDELNNKADKTELENYAKKNDVVDVTTYNSFVENQNAIDESQNNAIQDLEDNKADKDDIPDVSVFNPTDNFKTINGNSIIGTGDIHIEGGEGAVTSVNGQTGDVVIDIPEVPVNVSAFNNDAGYITQDALEDYAKKGETVDTNTYNEFVQNQNTIDESQNNAIQDLEDNKANKEDIPDVSIYNPTNNFKTINGNSVIGTGNIVIEGGEGTQEIIKLTQAEYDALGDDYDPNMLYVITDAENLYASKEDLQSYNPTNNFKTINYQSIIGEGNINIQGGEGTQEITRLTQAEYDGLEYKDPNMVYIITDAVNNYATKTDLTSYNPTNNFKTINGNSIIGTGDIQVQGGGGDVYTWGNNVFTGSNTFQQEVIFENTEYGIPQTDISQGVAANFKVTVTQSSVLFTGLISYPKTTIEIETGTGNYNITENEIKLGTDGTSVTPLGIYENGTLLSNKYAQLSDIPENVSAFNNDAGYLTQQDLSNYATKTEVTTTVDNKVNNLKIVWSGTQAAYDELTDKTEYMIYLIEQE